MWNERSIPIYSHISCNEMVEYLQLVSKFSKMITMTMSKNLDRILDMFLLFMDPNNIMILYNVTRIKDTYVLKIYQFGHLHYLETFYHRSLNVCICSCFATINNSQINSQRLIEWFYSHFSNNKKLFITK